ncbi:MAG: hypothetical protein NC911_00455 [Candidatus Omnitrophica bacterium]|nr:hypothetical protein [Candidatus Omnitrophota bacterium]
MKFWLSFCLGLNTWLAIASLVSAKDYYVNCLVGDDRFTGLSDKLGPDNQGPLATIAQALKKAEAGDTIHLIPTSQPYRETADFSGVKGGSPGKSLVLDGHGATLTGAEVCSPDGWKEWKEGIFRRDDLVSRIFLLVDGEMVFVTRNVDCLKPGEICFSPEELNRLHFWLPVGKKIDQLTIEVKQPDGTALTLDPAKWKRASSTNPNLLRYEGLKPPTQVKIDGKEVSLVLAKERLQPGQWCQEEKTMYYRLPADKRLSEVKISAIVRANGVQMTRETAYVVVRNLNVEHVYNDGFNIHGRVTHAEFYNCNARECGDEGFSAHDECETLLDTAVFLSCDNGIANVNQKGFSLTRNVIVGFSRSVGFLIQGTAKHQLSRAVLLNNPTQLSVINTQVEDCLIVNTFDSLVKNSVAIRSAGESSFTRLTTAGHTLPLFVAPGSKISLSDCLFSETGKFFHFRLDEPLNAVRMKNVSVGEGLKIEWGSNYPWKSLQFSEWLKLAEKQGVATGGRIFPMDWTRNLLQGKLPSTIPDIPGCPEEIIRKFIQFLESLQLSHSQSRGTSIFSLTPKIIAVLPLFPGWMSFTRPNPAGVLTHPMI